MARTYYVSFEGVTVSAPQDLLMIKGAAGKILRVLSVNLADIDTTAPTNQQLELRCRYLPATFSSGTGGNSSVPRPYDPGDAAASFTCLTNNTTKGGTNGTPAILKEDGCNIFSGYEYPFPRPPIIGPSEAFVFELLSSPSGTCTMSGGAVVEELGG
jgi:hypothetical protein